MDQGFRPRWPELALRSGVVPYRLSLTGRLQFLLIRRHSRHWWSFPKGHVVEGCTLVESAAMEAYEEAGLHGSVGTTPLGSYQYRKTAVGPAAAPRLVEVVLFPFEVEIEATHWPEMMLRERRWFERDRAADFVAPGALRNLLRTLVPLPIDEFGPRNRQRAPVPSLSAQSIAPGA